MNQKAKIILHLVLSFCVLLFALGVSVSEVNAQRASLYLAPSTGTYTVGNTFLVQVKVNSGGVAINAADATLVFDPDKLEVVKISKSDSIFSLWVQEPTFSNALGTITFAGGKPTPGYIGASGTIITITFRGKTADGVTVNFANGSVLADDGKGTNILASTGSGSYKLIAREVTPIEEEKKEEKPSEEEVTEEEEAATTPLPVLTEEKPTTTQPSGFLPKSLLWLTTLIEVVQKRFACRDIVFVLLILIILLLVIICYLCYRQFVRQKKIASEIRLLNLKIKAVFRALREEIDEQVASFDKSADLSKAEKRVRDKVQEALDTSEKFINKEINKIEKKL